MHALIDRTARRRERFDIRSLLPLLIVAAGIVAYYNSFSGTFVLDDDKHILENRRLYEILPLSTTLSGRRPVVDLTLAANLRFGLEGRRLEPWGFHAVNLAIHLLAALTLFGVVRRTLLLPRLRSLAGPAACWIALATALIWVVHPLVTQSVTYIIQRAESLMGLFYLLTLYCVIRGAGGTPSSAAGRRGHGDGDRNRAYPRRRRAESQPGGASGGQSPPHSGTGHTRTSAWRLAAVLCCALGMGSKGVMVTAPVVVLLYDWVFLADSFTQIIRRRWLLYAGLTATWGVLFACDVVQGVFSTAAASATVGLSYRGTTSASYAATQPGVLAHYLRLSLWPHPLCLDYEWPVAKSFSDVLCPSLVIAALLFGTAWGLFRKSWAGFIGAWFFLILAPTSSLIPIKDTLFEHRMYLPLAAVIVAVIIGARFLVSNVLTGPATKRGLQTAVLAAFAAGAVTLSAYGTIRRNRVYVSDLVVWRDVLEKRPRNARAYLGLGTALFHAKRYAAAEDAFEKAIRFEPNYAAAYHDLGNARERNGKLLEAEEAYRTSLRLRPSSAKVHFSLGKVLKKLDRLQEAVAEYREALSIAPKHVSSHVNLGNTLRMLGRYEEAIEEYDEALAIDPRHANARYNLGATLEELGRLDEAIAELKLACEYNPAHELARKLLEQVLARRPQSPED